MRSIWIRSVFLAMFLWWAYLFFATQFVVVYDAEGYESTGRMIAHQGFAEFLRTGPQREPMFAMIVALSVRLGDWWGISYHYPLKMIGLLYLLLTMVFSYRLMRMLAISRWLALLFVLYLGISPTMTTSCMRVWSEFAAYPWVVLAVIWTIKSWRSLDNLNDDRRGYLRIAGHAAMVALMFLLIMFVKAAAEGVLIFYLWPFYWRILAHWRAGNFIKARQVFLYCLIVFTVFEGVVFAYKACNNHYNGHFTFTYRGDSAFYGNTARRMEPLTLKRLGAAIAYVPGMGICSAYFSQDDCEFWSARNSDDIMGAKEKELAAQGIVSDQACTRYYIGTAVKMILSNPLQALLLMFIEAHKMFFWEPCVSFVAFPNWLEKIYFTPLYYDIIAIVFAFLSWASCFFAFIYLCRHYWKPALFDKERDGALLWVFNFIFWYAGMYSLFFILDRYSYPLVSLFMVLIAFLFHKIIKVFFNKKC